MARKRRGRGEGSIYQRSNGLWCATYSAGYDGSGHRKRRTIFGETKDDVQKKLQKKLNRATTSLAAARGESGSLRWQGRPRVR